MRICLYTKPHTTCPFGHSQTTFIPSLRLAVIPWKSMGPNDIQYQNGTCKFCKKYKCVSPKIVAPPRNGFSKNEERPFDPDCTVFLKIAAHAQGMNALRLQVVPPPCAKTTFCLGMQTYIQISHTVIVQPHYTCIGLHVSLVCYMSASQEVTCKGGDSFIDRWTKTHGYLL